MLSVTGIDKIMKNAAGASACVNWIPQFWSVRSMGGCMDALCVAAGRSEVWITLEANAWDLAPLKIIGEEAGARFFNLDGKSTIYGGNCVLSVPGLEDEIRAFMGIDSHTPEPR